MHGFLAHRPVDQGVSLNSLSQVCVKGTHCLDDQLSKQSRQAEGTSLQWVQRSRKQHPGRQAGKVVRHHPSRVQAAAWPAGAALAYVAEEVTAVLLCVGLIVHHNRALPAPQAHVGWLLRGGIPWVGQIPAGQFGSGLRTRV